MSSIDSRIVQLKFDNANFEANVKSTLVSLDKLKAGLAIDSSKSNLNGITNGAAEAGRNLGALRTIVDGVNAKFLALGTVAVTALANITTGAMNAGAQMAKSLTVEPIMTGFKEYETQMNSIQTILSNTQAAGTKLKDVTGALDELNVYADQTIYNFTEMTRNIGAFTAAGVGLDDSVAAIKGIANLAAMSGSNSQQAATAMYQLSQAISAGRVTLADWNSVANAGMGGAVFQRNLAETAVAMGVLDENSIKLTGDMKKLSINGQSFRESISAANGGETWLTSDVLTTALSTFTNDLSKAELAAIGFSKAQIKAIQAQAQTAQDAATKVKTLSQVFEVAKETVGSGWAQTFKTIFGDFNEAKSTFSGLSETVNGFLGSMAEARNELLTGWKDLGGRTVLIEGLQNAFEALMNILKPIKDAFRQIFPAKTAQDLYDATVAFRDFTEKLKIGADTANAIKRIFAGVFAVFKIIKTVVGAVASALFGLISPLTGVGGGFLDLLANVGDWLVSIEEMITKSGAIEKVFQAIGDALKIPIAFISDLANKIRSLFGAETADSVSQVGESFGRVGDRLDSLKGYFEDTKNAIADFITNIAGSGTVLGTFIDNVKNEFAKIGDAIAEGMKSGNFDKALDIINTGLFAGLLLLFKRFVDQGASLFKIGFGDEAAGAISKLADSVTNSLGAMTAQLRASALLKIAIAIGILSASLIALSLVDSNKLTSGLAAITALFLEIVAVLTAIDRLVGAKSSLSLPAVGLGLILIATSMLVFAQAVKKLGEGDPEETATGLIAIAGGIALLTGSILIIGKQSATIILTAIAMWQIANALTNLANSVERFGNMDWLVMTRGFIGVTAGLVLMSRAMAGLPSKNNLEKGAALIMLSIALNLVAIAIERLGNLDMAQLAKGVIAVGASLAAIGGAMQSFPKDMIRKAAGVLIISVAIQLIARAIENLGKQDIGTLAAGLISLGAALTIIAIATQRMEKALPGAGAFAVIAASLFIFAPALAMLGSIPIPVIVTGLLALAGAFAVIGVASLLLTEAVPAMLALGGSLALIGLAVALTGAGVWLFVKALQVLIEIGKMAAETIASAFLNIGKAIPAMMATLTAFLVSLAGVIAAVAPEWTKAFVAVLTSMLKAFIQVAPKIKKATIALIDLILGVIDAKHKDVIETGFQLLLAFVQGLGLKIRPLVDAAVDLVIKFTKALGDRAQDLVEAGLDFVIKIANGVADGYYSRKAELEAAGRNLAGAIIDGMTFGLSGRLGDLLNQVGGIAQAIVDKAKSVFQVQSPSKVFNEIGKFLMVGLEQGIIGNRDEVLATLDDLKYRMKSEKEYWEAEAERLTELRKQAKEQGASQEKLDKITEKLNRATDAAKRAAAGFAETTKQIKAQKARLAELGALWDEQNDKLDDAVARQNEYNNMMQSFYDNTKSQYSQLPDIGDGEDQLTLDEYFNSIRSSTAANNNFLASLNELRAMGLDDTSYQKLLNEGIDAQPFIDSLRNAGPAAVAELNTVNQGLLDSAATIASTTRDSLYKAGADAIQGEIDGIRSQIGLLEAEMTGIAKIMVAAIKKALKIKSPSRVFMEVGKLANQGLAKGLDDYSKYSAQAASQTGKDATEALKKSFSDISHLDFDIETDPVITPVLDLNQFMSGVSQMNSAMAQPVVTPVVGRNAANSIANLDAAFQAIVDGLSGKPTTIEYNQYNNSPKALSNAEIYRRTKNQLSVLKGALSDT